MTKRDIIVVGTSAGGVTALKSFVAFLPAERLRFRQNPNFKTGDAAFKN